MNFDEMSENNNKNSLNINENQILFINLYFKNIFIFMFPHFSISNNNIAKNNNNLI